MSEVLRFEKIGREFIIFTPPGYLNQYSQYFQNLGGKYDEIIQGPIGNSYLIGRWIFNSRKEQEVRRLLDQILSGQLLPPEQLAPAQQLSINLSEPVSLSIPESVIQPPAQIYPIGNIPTPVEPPPRKKQAPPSPSMTPSQVIASTLKNQPIQTSLPSVINPQTQVPLPTYDPLDREVGESQEEYNVRKYLYEYLLSNNIPPDAADTLSRMRNDVDILGVTYNPIAMEILNKYLPRQ